MHFISLPKIGYNYTKLANCKCGGVVHLAVLNKRQFHLQPVGATKNKKHIGLL